MKFLFTAIVVFLNVVFVQSTFAQKINPDKQFKFAVAQATQMLSTMDSMRANGLPANLIAPRTSENGKLKVVNAKDWTSGFFSGELWFLYEFTKENKWLNAARKYTASLESIQYFGGHHDLGFMMYCSY